MGRTPTQVSRRNQTDGGSNHPQPKPTVKGLNETAHGSSQQVKRLATSRACYQRGYSRPWNFRRPNGQRISGERRAEGDERVRCMGVLGSRKFFLDAGDKAFADLKKSLGIREHLASGPRMTLSFRTR